MDFSLITERVWVINCAVLSLGGGGRACAAVVSIVFGFAFEVFVCGLKS